MYDSVRNRPCFGRLSAVAKWLSDMIPGGIVTLLYILPLRTQFVDKLLYARLSVDLANPINDTEMANPFAADLGRGENNRDFFCMCAYDRVFMH